MTLVQYKNLKPANKSFNNLVDDFFNGWPSILRDDAGLNINQTVPVNIKETENGYLLELVAPGMQKEDFRINLDNNLLTVSVEKKAETENNSEKSIRREYKFNSFKRSFTIDEKIDAENINATYLNGVLTLNLPKKAEVKTPAKEISIQ